MTRWRVKVARDAAGFFTPAQADALEAKEITAPGVVMAEAGLLMLLGLELVAAPEDAAMARRADAEARADIGDTMRFRAKQERAQTGKPPWGG